MSKQDRINQLHRLLRSRRHPIQLKEIAEHLQCSEKTARRCIDDLQDYTHAPIEYCQESKGWRYSQGTKNVLELPGTWFSSQELQGLFALLQLLQSLQSSAITLDLTAIDSKITQLLRASGLEVNTIKEKIKYLSLNRHLGNESIFSQLAKSTFASQCVHIKYSDYSNKITHRVISPIQLVYYRENWYLDAWCHLRQQLRSFMLVRIQQVKTASNAFIKINQEQIDQHYATAYGIFAGEAPNKAELKFYPPQAFEAAAKQWHPQQQATWQNGCYFLSFPYGDTRELIRDILSFGANIEIIAPASLRKTLLEQVHKIDALYR